MNPTIKIAQKACESAGARQAVVVLIDEFGRYACVSYGETKAECTAVKPLCSAIADQIDDGELPMPQRGRSFTPCVDVIRPRGANL